jgi:Glycosyl hydrolases family 35
MWQWNSKSSQVVLRFFRGDVSKQNAEKDPTPDPWRPFRTRDTSYGRSKALRRAVCSVFITLLAATFFPGYSSAQKIPAQKPLAPPVGVQIVSNAGHPELRVDGVPFFVHAAQFDYFRIPADLWFRSLDRYRELGINTIDLRIPWNWHEIRDAEFDFDGHTNPRRDLRSLLYLIAEKHFKLIARPGPMIGDHWRNEGYPAWLLRYSDYKMSESAIEAGIAPLDAELATRDGNAAAQDWLANETHMTYARRWLTAIAKELAPYGSKNTVRITEPGDREGEIQEKEISGPLLFVALDDAVAIRTGSGAPDLSRYLSELRRGLARGGLDAASFMNVPDVVSQGAPSLSAASATEDLKAVGLTGEWQFKPSTGPPGTSRTGAPTSDSQNRARLTTRDALSLSFLANSLGTQPDFPPLLSGFATTTFAPADDIRVRQPPSENMLLASRLLLGGGVRGITYSPLQDTLTPAGWGTPYAARYFRWDAALDLAGNRGPNTNGVIRNGQLISAWGAMLASSHPRADFGIVDLRTCLGGTPGDEAAASHITRTIEQVVSFAGQAGYAPELLNPAAQPEERLRHNAVILLPVPEGNGGNLPLSEKAHSALTEFVRGGGVLIFFPSRPPGALLEQLWQAAPAIPSMSESIIEWPLERGRMIASSNDLSSWVSLADDLQQNPPQDESSPAAESLTSLLVRAGASRSLRRITSGKFNSDVFIAQLISNEGSPSSARPRACVEEQLCAAALVSVTNLSADEIREESFEITDPAAHSAKVTPAAISFDVNVPPHESLLLPVHAPLCSATADEHCTDEVISSGAELLGAERDGKTLQLAFYAPARATVRLHLESQPTKVELGEDFRLESQWKQETGELEFSLLRGAAPGYRRVILIHLRYTPHVVERPDPGKTQRRASEYDVFDAVRLPLATDASIPSGPPLILTGPGGGGHLVISSRNRTDNMRPVEFSLDGAFHGTGSGRLYPGEQLLGPLRFQATHNSASADPSPIPGADGLLQGQLTVRSGHEQGSVPILFVAANEAGNTHYQYDFDRDGAPEWVLESNRLRLIASPADGGRALALVDKSTDDDLITLGGAFRDFLVPETTAPAAMPAPGDFASNRAYRASWVEEKLGTGLQLDYSEHENSLAGLHIKKILRLTAPETVEAAYRISLASGPFDPTNDPGPKQSFISKLSVPATASEDATTHFCWQPEPSFVPQATPTGPAKSAPGPHCDDFVASGKPIMIPAEITRLEIRTSGHSTLAVEWTAARATIVPKNFSAQVEFALPAPLPGDAPAEFTLRYTVGEAGP